MLRWQQQQQVLAIGVDSPVDTQVRHIQALGNLADTQAHKRLTVSEAGRQPFFCQQSANLLDPLSCCLTFDMRNYNFGNLGIWHERHQRRLPSSAGEKVVLVMASTLVVHRRGKQRLHTNLL